jgi:hypothetical protein
MRLRRLAPILAWSIALASGCGHENGPPPAPSPAPSIQTPALPSAVTAHIGEGPIQVYGANVYSAGQEIYKALRQEDSLMAFLACQGEPDRVEVRENEDPDALPRIILEYTRRTRGTVTIEPTASGYYAARPIDPSGSLKSAPKKGSEPPAHPNKPARKPKETQVPPPSREPERAPEPPAPQAPTEPPQAAPAIREPTPAQLDECPIEPWRADCRDLCVPGAGWEWCSYRD